MATVLVVEDDVRLATLVGEVLEEDGHAVQVAHDGEQALGMALSDAVDVIVLDVMLPSMDGVSVCRRLRDEQRGTAVLLLTALGAVEDRVLGLDAGADDYLVKPFAMAELCARVRALARRPAGMRGSDLRIADLVINPLRHEAWRDGRRLELTARELRTPLTLLRAEAEALARSLNAARETRPLLNQIDRISRLVRDLLTLARLDERALPLERELVPVLALVRTAAAAGERLARPGIAIDVQSPPDLCVDGDVDRLHQVLLILMDNACQVTPPGGRIGLIAERDGNAVTIRVEDTGPGIPREHLTHIFDRFYRVDPARSRGDRGAGLGLAIARRIVEAHGGNISLTSRLGHGTSATLRLPVALS